MTAKLPGSTRYKRPDAPGGRPHRVRVQLTDAELQLLQQESAEQHKGVAQLLVEGWIHPDKLDPRILMREVAGVRRILTEETEFLQQLARDRAVSDQLWEQIAEGIHWRNDRLKERYEW